MFLFSAALMLLAYFVAVTLIKLEEGYSHSLTFVANMMGLGIYTVVLFASGHSRRFIPVLSAIIACNSILSLLFIAVYILLAPFLGPDTANLIAGLIIIWSIPVEGHIIARGIEQDLYVGIGIALIVFVALYTFQSSVAGRP